MSRSATLRVVERQSTPPSGRRRATRAPRGVVGQVRAAFAPGARLAACFGVLLGGAIPWLTYRTAHGDGFQLLSVAGGFVLGGLLYSGPTVWAWIRTFKGAWPALGFVVLLEGLMVTSRDTVVTYAALAMLVAINAVSTACALAREKP